MKKASIKAVIEKYRHEVMKVHGVEGIAAGRSRSGAKGLVILVYARTTRPAGLPTELDGYPVEVVPTSGFKAF